MAQGFARRDLERLPEGFPAELIAGCLVKEPAPTCRHRRIRMRLLRRLAPLVGDDLFAP